MNECSKSRYVLNINLQNKYLIDENYTEKDLYKICNGALAHKNKNTETCF